MTEIASCAPRQPCAGIGSLSSKATPWRRLGLGSCTKLAAASPADDVDAAHWYRLAADQGHDRAQYLLGLMYVEGRGVPQDDVSAHMWLNLATAQFTGEEREQSATMRDAVAERMTREDLSEAQRLAREWAPE